MKNRLNVWLPFIVALSIAIGVLVGNFYNKAGGRASGYLSPANNKINAVLEIIDEKYVDTVRVKDLIEDVIPKIFEELDPHSMYIPAKEAQSVNEELDGSFSGIGVSFNMQTDTILLLNVFAGGPSEQAGLQPFDRIVTINDSIFAGKDIDQNEVVKNLKGPRGSKVTLGVKRRNKPDMLYFDVVRGDVPVNSIEVAYEIRKNIGFIKVSRFTRTSYQDFITALARLKKEGCNAFIIDLRGNTGGIMETAISMINEFMPASRLIVYMEGKSYPRSNMFSTGNGSCIEDDIVVLTDENSASASEIFAGAIQDNDRGLIIGRRTFGKGLVQTSVGLADGSELRLTVARYYTPSGRSIQKKYELGHSEDYEMDIYNRYKHGEFYTRDSIKTDSLPQYQTVMGRTVYGGGGIIPDIFIPSDTTGLTSYFNSVTKYPNVLNLYTLLYSDQHYDLLRSFGTYREMYDYLSGQPLLDDFTDFAVEHGIKKRPALIEISAKLIEIHLVSLIIKNFFDNDGFFPIYYDDDNTVRQAVKVIQEGKATPTACYIYDTDIPESQSTARNYTLARELNRTNPKA
ncbi:MAG: S41 family peptidase [Tannerellaceae bacterium]|jgi:carboxyl-terminal processing protease|nr:S41 family peptidase [Tannerellaceae bacterium]